MVVLSVADKKTNHHTTTNCNKNASESPDVALTNSSSSKIDPYYSADRDGLVLVDITVKDGKIDRIKQSEDKEEGESNGQLGTILDAKKGVCMPTFCDIHTHVDKSHTCERSRNESGSLAGADKSCEIDEIHWTEEELTLRMEFSLKTAYAHGTSAILSLIHI